RVDLEARRPLGLGRRRLELGEHPIEAAYFAIPTCLEQAARPGVRFEGPGMRGGQSSLPHPLLTARDEPAAESDPLAVRMHVPVDVGTLRMREDHDIGSDRPILDYPRVPFEVQQPP